MPRFYSSPYHAGELRRAVRLGSVCRSGENPSYERQRRRGCSPDHTARHLPVVFAPIARPPKAGNEVQPKSCERCDEQGKYDNHNASFARSASGLWFEAPVGPPQRRRHRCIHDNGQEKDNKDNGANARSGPVSRRRRPPFVGHGSGLFVAVQYRAHRFTYTVSRSTVSTVTRRLPECVNKIGSWEEFYGSCRQAQTART